MPSVEMRPRTEMRLPPQAIRLADERNEELSRSESRKSPRVAHGWFADCSQAIVMGCGKPKKNDAHPTVQPVEISLCDIGFS